MINKLKQTVLFFGFISFFYSCEFSPSEIPVTQVEKPSVEPPSIFVELSPAIDTLRLTESAWVSYSAVTGEHELARIDFKIDNESYYDYYFVTRNKVSARIPVESLADGNHQLQIITYTATNSGSIADKLGAEVYWYEIKWPLYINKAAKNNYKFYKIDTIPDNGLGVSWPEYRYLDFDRYEFSWNLNGYKEGKVTSTNPRKNSYFDSLYVEGFYAYYSIFTYYKESGTNIDFMDYHKDIISPKVKVNNDCTVDFQWTHSKYENRVQQYCLITSIKGENQILEKDFTNLNDTTFHWSSRIAFGKDFQTQLRYIPKDYNGYHGPLNTAGGSVTFAIGNSMPKFKKAYNITAENALILYNDGLFTKWNYSTGATTNLPVSQYLQLISSSPDGNYFGFIENKEYVVCQSSDMTIVKRLNIEAYDENNYFLLNSVSISDNGLISTSDNNRNIKIFDLSTGNKIFSKQYSVTNFCLKFSPDGKSLMAEYYNYSTNKRELVCFSFDGSQLVELGKVSDVEYDVGTVIAYYPQEYQKLIVSYWHDSYEYTVEIRDSHTFELLSSFDVTENYVPMYVDFTTNQVIAQNCYSSALSYSYLIDMTTMQQKKMVQFIGREEKVFTKGMVYSGNGRSILLSDYMFE